MYSGDPTLAAAYSVYYDSLTGDDDTTDTEEEEEETDEEDEDEDEEDEDDDEDDDDDDDDDDGEYCSDSFDSDRNECKYDSSRSSRRDVRRSASSMPPALGEFIDSMRHILAARPPQIILDD